jgi:hypothetical protein
MAVFYEFIIAFQSLKNNINKDKIMAKKQVAFWYVLAKKMIALQKGKTKLCLK